MPRTQILLLEGLLDLHNEEIPLQDITYHVVRRGVSES